MHDILITSQVVISILLIIVVLVQNKDGGLSTIMGGSTESFQTEKRGAEKVLHQATILFAFLFLFNAFVFVLI